MQRWHSQFCISRDSQMISSNLLNEKVECKSNYYAAVASTRGSSLATTFCKLEFVAGTLLNPLCPRYSTSHIYTTCREYKSHDALYNWYPGVLESTKVWDDCMNLSSSHNRSVWGCHLTTRTTNTFVVATKWQNQHKRMCTIKKSQMTNFW